MDYSQYNHEKTGYLKEDFRLFHINDRTKKEFSYHYHDFHKIIVFISGKVTYHIEGKAYHLKPRDILLVSQGAIHKPEIEQTLRNEQFGEEALRNALFTQFMVYINRIFLRTSSTPDKKSYSSDSQVEQLLKYINRNLSDDLSIDQLADHFFFSKYHMMRKFKAETGYTIHSYVTNKRLLLARSLLSQGTPVMKAAEKSGFQDYTTFVRAYKKQFGKVPSCE